ncbi:MAG TPA: type II toxin-antitoxin system RelE/ParE family toxin, partial [Dehalococcoidia bacterium]|nr:type II toxin-antitoxin system RelE/ParE family toxin [Dehalococcoidia bacterium]
LMDAPARETRNKKRLRSNPLASWELRLGALRVFYDVFTEPDNLVAILAVGIKKRNQVRLGSKDYPL